MHLCIFLNKGTSPSYLKGVKFAPRMQLEKGPKYENNCIFSCIILIPPFHHPFSSNFGQIFISLDNTLFVVFGHLVFKLHLIFSMTWITAPLLHSKIHNKVDSILTNIKSFYWSPLFWIRSPVHLLGIL